jgi:hypothetical protein
MATSKSFTSLSTYLDMNSSCLGSLAPCKFALLGCYRSPGFSLLYVKILANYCCCSEHVPQMLSVLALGFGQGLYALSVADGGEVDDLPEVSA